MIIKISEGLNDCIFKNYFFEKIKPDKGGRKRGKYSPWICDQGTEIQLTGPGFRTESGMTEPYEGIRGTDLFKKFLSILDPSNPDVCPVTCLRATTHRQAKKTGGKENGL